MTAQPEHIPAPGPNSLGEIERRRALGRLTWTGPILLTLSRTVLLIFFQAAVAGIYALRHHPSPWRAAAPWWSIFGTLVDVACLLLLSRFTRGEGLRIRDLIGAIRLRRGRDILGGVGYYLVIFPCFLGGSLLTSLLVYGSIGPRLPPGLLDRRVLPAWAFVYTLSLWWIVWAPTEEITYQGYVLPRLEALTRRPWLAILIVAFFWTLQHCFLPFIFDWRYLLWRFGSFLPGVLVTILIYRRTRRLFPFIVAHWPMDIAAAIFTVTF